MCLGYLKPTSSLISPPPVNLRVLVRSSGTEPVVRVMVEAREHDIAESVAATLVAAITARLG